MPSSIWAVSRLPRAVRIVCLVVIATWLSLAPTNLALAAPNYVAPTSSEYVVRPGDTLWSIATRYGVSLASLASINGIANPNVIYSGQVLTIPGQRPPAQPPAQMRPAAPSSGSILAGHRLLTYYGNPYSSQMGILGQLSPGELVNALNQRAALYEQAGGKPVQPAIELVAIVAQAGPGSDGMYRAKMPDSVIQEYADLAAANGMLLILDVQVGRSTVQDEIESLRPFLELPHVHLALDPEFDMWGSQLPGVQIGSMTAAEINYATGVLADIVARHGYTNKILIVHQFTPFMIADKGNVVVHPSVDLAVVMDGFGTWDLKTKHYNMFVRDEPLDFGGIKLFFDQDTPLVPAADVVALEPAPDVVIYQ